MDRSAVAVRRSQWLKRLRRFTRSQLTVAEFCSREKVSIASFYQWRNKLAETATTDDTTGRPSVSPTFVPVQVTNVANLQVDFPNGTRVTLPTHDHELVKLSIAAIAMAQTTTGEG